MSPTAAALLAAALELPPDEREEVADHLFDSLDPPPGSPIDAMTDEEFSAGLDRRREEARRDPSVMTPWEQVRDHLR